MHSDRLTILLNSWCYAARCDLVMNVFRRPLEEPFEPAFFFAMCTFNQTLYCIADSLSDMQMWDLSREIVEIVLSMSKIFETVVVSPVQSLWL